MKKKISLVLGICLLGGLVFMVHICPKSFDEVKWNKVSVWQIKALLKFGEDVNTKDKNGETPLLKATQYSDNPAVIEALIKAGADVNAKKDQDGQTPLLRECVPFVWEINLARRNLAGVEALIKAGADVKERDKNGGTPLMWAAGTNGNPAVVETLIAVGADTKARDKFGNKAIDFVAQNPALKETSAYWKLHDLEYEK